MRPTLEQELAIARNAIRTANGNGLHVLEHEARRLATFDDFASDEIVAGLVEAARHLSDAETLRHVIVVGMSDQSAFAIDTPLETSRRREVHSQQQPTLEVLCLADVKPQPIEWLWPNWIAIGKVSCLAGVGGQGKSTVLCDVAARTTRGEQWPDGAPGSEAGSIIILSAEDDPADTVVPRLMAVGADRRRMFTIRSVRNSDQTRRTFNLQADLAQLEALIEKKGDVRLVIIDPISSYLGKTDSHKNSEVRTVLEPLAEMASRMRVAVICNNHFSKASGDANNRIIGSVAFVNQARAAFIVTPDADDADRYLLMPSKMNIAPIKHGLAYRIEGCLIPGDDGEILTSRIAWETTPITITANEALAAHDDNLEAKTATAEAIDVLTDVLSRGEMAAKDVELAAKNAGVTAKPLRNARNVLRVVSRREGFGPGAVYYWSLPDTMDAQSGHGCPLSGMGIHGEKGQA